MLLNVLSLGPICCVAISDNLEVGLALSEVSFCRSYTFLSANELLLDPLVYKSTFLVKATPMLDLLYKFGAENLQLGYPFHILLSLKLVLVDLSLLLLLKLPSSVAFASLGLA